MGLGWGHKRFIGLGHRVQVLADHVLGEQDFQFRHFGAKVSTILVPGSRRERMQFQCMVEAESKEQQQARSCIASMDFQAFSAELPKNPITLTADNVGLLLRVTCCQQAQ